MELFSEFSPSEIADVINSNPSLRGYLQGYLAEVALQKKLRNLPGVESVVKIPDSKKIKADIEVMYKGTSITIEVKSLKTSSVRRNPLYDTWSGSVRINNTDRRKHLVDGIGIVESTHLTRGGFDILAISTYALNNSWEFLYIANEFLPSVSPLSPNTLKTSFVVDILETPNVTSNISLLLEEKFLQKTGTKIENEIFS